MNRRTLMKSSALAVPALAANGPIILGAEKRTDVESPVLGVDGHKYQCLHNWGELPNDYSWQTTHNVAIDSQGLVYITHQGIGKKMDTILVFDPKGKFVRSFGKEFHGGGHGIEIRKEGSDEFCYLSNTWTPELKVMKTTLKGEKVWTKGRPECKEYEDPKKGYNPTNISFLPDGGFTVGDGYGSGYMMIYDKDAKLTGTFGGTGEKDGQFRTPHGQVTDLRNPNHPMIVVCDRANQRLQWFDLNGKFIKASKPREMVSFPAHGRTRGDVMMIPDLHTRVSLFDKNNKLIVHLGEELPWRAWVVGSLDAKNNLGPAVRTQPKLWRPGRFVHPHDAAFDHDGNIFVVEWVSTGRVTLLKKVA